MMNVLQTIGIQQWRLRGRKARVAPIAEAQSSSLQESQAKIPERAHEKEPTQLADEGEKGDQYSTAQVPVRQPASEPTSEQRSAMAEFQESSTPKPEIRQNAETEQTKSDSFASDSERMPKGDESKDRPKQGEAEVVMPTLRPAPVPLEREPVMDLTIAEPAPTVSEVDSYGEIPPPEYDEADASLVENERSLESAAVSAELADLDWRALQARISDASHCPSCGNDCSGLGFGDVLADWVFVSDALTNAEHQAQQLHIGRAGQLYEAILHACGLQRDQVYTTSVFKCAPPEDLSLTPQCGKIIHRQLELIQPKVIIAFGEFAAQAVLRANESLAQLQGMSLTYSFAENQQRCDVIVSHSPQQLLAQPALKAILWRQLKSALNTHSH